MDPLAIGGVGGSGTRVVANVLARAGAYVGGDLNVASDNLWFTLLFKRLEVLDLPLRDFVELVRLFESRMTSGPPWRPGDRELVAAAGRKERPQHSRPWLQQRVDSFLSAPPPPPGVPWGWKEPNTHIVLERLVEALPALRYIHIARSGLDMAYSDNQNQPRLWGSLFGLEFDETPRCSLRFWRLAHERVLDIGSTMGDRFLFVRFEDLCSEPERVVSEMLTFMGAERRLQAQDLVGDVRQPATVGRHRVAGLDGFDPEDVEYVAGLGFPV